ncbi:MAG: DUF4476 domain-containing protein [Bacteroidia bacterium]
MKKALLTIYVLFRILLVEGSHLNSELNLKLQNGGYFTTVLNNYHYYNQPVQSLNLSQPEPGRYALTVKESRYNNWMNSWNEHLVYNGYIDLPAASRVHAMIDNFGRLVVTHIYQLVPPVPVSYHYNNNSPHSTHYYNVISPAAFDNLQHVIRNQSFDSSKLKIAKQAIATNNIRSSQVLQLMNLLTFESYKLDLAKFAYSYTLDKQNYFMLYDGFTFQSSINQLSRHIGQGNNYTWQ